MKKVSWFLKVVFLIVSGFLLLPSTGIDRTAKAQDPTDCQQSSGCAQRSGGGCYCMADALGCGCYIPPQQTNCGTCSGGS